MDRERGRRGHLTNAGTATETGGDTGAAALIGGVGVMLGGLTVWHFLIFEPLSLSVQGDGIPRLGLRLLGALLTGTSAAGLIYGGYWLAASSFEHRRAWRVGEWTLVGLAGVVALAALAWGVRIWSGQSIDPALLVEELLLAASGGGIVGLLVGTSTARATRNRERVRHQRDTLEFMNEILRHNVLNGMQLILGHAELVREEADEDRLDTDRLLERLDAVEARGEDVVELVENVRVLARSISEDVETKPVPLSSILREEVETARREYDATFETEVPDGVRVRADELLGAVFENLLANAVDHNDADEPRVRLAATVEGDRVRVTVADNGPGVPDDAKERYFEAGEQDPGSVGQGLGLYLVDTLVSRYGGDVWVDDNEPRGAVFTVELARA